MIYSGKNKPNLYIKSKLISIYKVNIIVPIISLIMFVYIPTSHNSIIYNVSWLINVWTIAFIIVISLAFVNKSYDLKSILIFLFTTIYLSTITAIISNRDFGARISLARIAPVIIIMMLCCIRIRCNNNFLIMKRLLDLFFISMIIWNLMILADSTYIKEFTFNNYSQYYVNALIYSVFQNKPVMSFGVHTYASYFYMLFFYLSYQTAKVTKEKRYYIYCLLTIIFTFMLTSNSSLIYAFIMILIFLRLLKAKPIFTIITIVLGILTLAYYSGFLIEKYKVISQSKGNGFLARYFGENTAFESNINFIKNYYAVGFNIIDDLNYSDSGYMMYLTMGNFPFAFLIYFQIYNFLKNNIPKPYLLSVAFVIFSFEVALPATFNYRFFFAIIFIIYYLRSLEEYRNARFISI